MALTTRQDKTRIRQLINFHGITKRLGHADQKAASDMLQQALKSLWGN